MLSAKVREGLHVTVWSPEHDQQHRKHVKTWRNVEPQAQGQNYSIRICILTRTPGDPCVKSAKPWAQALPSGENTSSSVPLHSLIVGSSHRLRIAIPGKRVGPLGLISVPPWVHLNPCCQIPSLAEGREAQRRHMGWNDLLKNGIRVTFPSTLLCKTFTPTVNGKTVV